MYKWVYSNVEIMNVKMNKERMCGKGKNIAPYTIICEPK